MPIQDPHQAEMERRLLLAMGLSVAVLLLSQYFYYALYPPPPPPPTPPPAQREKTATDAAGPPLVAAPTEEMALPATVAEKRTVAVENEHLILRWSNVGAVLESARLKHYTSPAGQPLEIIPQELPSDLNRAFTIQVGDAALDKRLANASYEVEGVGFGRIRAPVEITFRYRDEAVEVVRKIRVPAAGYVLEMGAEVRSRQGSLPYTIVLGPGLGEAVPSPQGDFSNPQVAVYSGTAVDRYGAGDLEGGALPIAAGSRWAAVDSQYFACLILHPEGFRAGRILSTTLPPAAGTETASLLGAEVGLAPGVQHTAFIGPKVHEALQEADPTASLLIDYGWLAFLVKPLLFCLKLIYGYIHNYGWSIIILTFVINLVLFPLRYKQMASMKKMAEVQPQMKAIQEKYKRMKRDDPRKQKMNEEVMALYKKHGVNPLGGCLPLVIQMPFLFAFYQMLYLSIELRGAPFMGWIQDLSQPDPIYVTPVLMGVSMVVQQKMTPAAGDPTQRRMMMLLPVVFTFFFLNFSSGLVLYFLFSNLFGMMLQLLLQKWSPEPLPAKRAKTGRGKKRAKKN